jgi:uncharacterized protein (DUF697 family)/tellurite resistance protein
LEHFFAMPADTISAQEHRAIISVCVFAAFADGAQDEAEHARIQQIVNGFSGEQIDPAPVYQEVLEGNFPLATAATQLQSPAAKALAYEMAVCVCNADGVLSESEKKLLSDLRQALRLDTSSADAHQDTAQALATHPLPLPPAIDPGREAELDKLILNTAILNGALEIMPHTLATMAIIPLQIRMVYRIGSRYGYELDRGHIKDFLATVGIGLTSQVFEGFTRRLVGGFARGLAGGLLGGLVGQATGSAFGFATTYALGEVAKRYYAGGRTLSTAQLKEAFSSMLQDARSRQGRYAGDITEKSRQVNVSELLPMIRQQ